MATKKAARWSTTLTDGKLYLYATDIVEQERRRETSYYTMPPETAKPMTEDDCISLAGILLNHVNDVRHNRARRQEEKRDREREAREDLNEHAIQESVRKGRKPVYHGNVYLLPTGTKLNPTTGEGEYADDGQVAYVLRRTDKVRKNGASCVATSFGTVDMVVGDTLTVRHDQTRQRMGEYEIVGIKVFKTGRGVGDVPNRMINHRVFK